jgi:hypothetical protein
VLLDLLEDGRGTRVIIPESGRQRELFVLGYFLLTVLDVKETSLERLPDPALI